MTHGPICHTELWGSESTWSALAELRQLRISVIGCNCSGKTTFSHRLSRVLEIPHIQMDQLYWTPNWIPKKSEAFYAELTTALSQDAWIADGNYPSFQQIVWSRSTTIIWLNYPFTLVAWRTLKRTTLNLLQRSEVYGGNFESFQRLLSRNSMFWLLYPRWRYYQKRYQAFFRESAGTSAFPYLIKIEIHSPQEAEVFLACCER